MGLRRFGDVAVDPEQVICVSRKVAKMESEKSGEDGGIIVDREDRSSMILRVDSVTMQIEISEQAADDLLDYFQRNPADKSNCCKPDGKCTK